MDTKLANLTKALNKSWDIDTCDKPKEWTTQNSSRGQCGVTALVVHDHFGGQILCSKVSLEGQFDGYHYSNQLPDGRIIDLTKEQFGPGETFEKPEIVVRIGELPRNGANRYVLLRDRVNRLLNIYPP